MKIDQIREKKFAYKSMKQSDNPSSDQKIGVALQIVSIFFILFYNFDLQKSKKKKI